MTMLPSFGDRRFVVGSVSSGHFLSHFYLLSFPPLFPQLLEAFSLTNTQLGLIVAAIQLPIMLFQIPVGQVVDRIGAKRVFVLGLGLTSLGILLAGFAPGYWPLLGFAVLSGIGQSAFHPADYALLDAVMVEGSEGRSFSIHTFGGFAGFAAAPLVVGGLGVLVGWRPALVTAGGVGIAAALLAELTLEPVYLTDRATRSEAVAGASNQGILEDLAVVASPSMVAVFLFFMVLFAAGTGIQSFTTVFLHNGAGLPETIGNTALTGFFTLSAIGILIGGPFADRFDVHVVIGLCLLVAGGLTWILVTGVLEITTLVAVGLLSIVGFFSGMLRPSRDRLVSLHSPPESAGRSFGFVFTGGSLGGFLGPILLGRAIDLRGPAVAFVAIGGFFLLAGAVVVGMKFGPSIRSGSASQ